MQAAITSLIIKKEILPYLHLFPGTKLQSRTRTSDTSGKSSSRSSALFTLRGCLPTQWKECSSLNRYVILFYTIKNIFQLSYEFL